MYASSSPSPKRSPGHCETKEFSLNNNSIYGISTVGYDDGFTLSGCFSPRKNTILGRVPYGTEKPNETKVS